MIKRYPPHGTRPRYTGSRTRPGCRCRRCRRANTEYMRAYRAAQRLAELSNERQVAR